MMPRIFLACGLCVALLAPVARAESLDELSLTEWKDLREVERYQLQIAEKYWREQNWKTAAGEYEKFLELYEKSHAAPYAQLKWSLAQVKLRQQNTAIKEGFQTVMDYWPDSSQAIAAAYYLGRTQHEIGRNKEAKASLKKVVEKYPQHIAAVFALNVLQEISTQEKDAPAKLEYWKKLTFDIKRTPETNNVCVQASLQLAAHQFRSAAFAEGVQALATSYKPAVLPSQVATAVRGPLAELIGQAETKSQGNKLADQALAWFKQSAQEDRSTPEGQQLARVCLLAMADLTAVAQRDDQVPAAYEVVVKTFAPDDDALGKLAAWYKTKQKYELARETYRRYQDKHEGLGLVAFSFREQQNWKSAVQNYTQLIAQDAERKVRWKSELAQTHRAAKQWQEAIATYEELTTDDIAQAGRWRWEIGNTYREAGQYKEAIGVYRQCENFPENYKQMAACHRQLKQPAEAIILYNQIGGDKASAPWALLQVAYTREEAGQTEPAIQAFQQVCKRFPKDSHAATAHAHLQQKYKISVTLGGTTEE
jgi:tetratricopeptide (TPR) repeat protein